MLLRLVSSHSARCVSESAPAPTLGLMLDILPYAQHTEFHASVSGANPATLRDPFSHEA